MSTAGNHSAEAGQESTTSTPSPTSPADEAHTALTAPAAFGELLWTPDSRFQQNSALHRYLDWLPSQGVGPFGDYAAAWQWSVDHPAEFWETVWR